jgi:hypothetical protein
VHSSRLEVRSIHSLGNNACLTSSAAELQDNEERISEFKKLLSELPECHYLTFQRMIKLCVKLDEKREVNKMTAYNISTVLGPNLLYGTDMNPSK